MNIYARLSIMLFLICALSAGALAIVNSATHERIRANEEYKERILRGQALAGAEGDKVVFDPQPIQIGQTKYYVGRLNGRLIGTAFTAATNKGYGGPIEVVIGMNKNGEELNGIRVKSSSETPGLGANATQVRYGEAEPWFLAQFKGLRPDEIWLKKDNPNGEIDAITAATITSRAITDLVHQETVEFEKKVLPELKEDPQYACAK